MSNLFAVVAMVAIANTTLVAVVTQPGTLLTQAGSAVDLVARLATVTVLFLLFIYALVIISALKLRGQDEDEKTFHANTALLYVGLVGNAAILCWSVYDDPASLLWCAALVGVGVVLFVIERVFGTKERAAA